MVVYVSVGEGGVRLEVKRNVVEGYEVSELLLGMCRKPELEVWEKEPRGITEVNGSARVLVVWNGARNQFFYEFVLTDGATKRNGVGKGCGCVTIEGGLDGGERRNLEEIAGVAVGNDVASEVEVVARGGGDGLN